MVGCFGRAAKNGQEIRLDLDNELEGASAPAPAPAPALETLDEDDGLTPQTRNGFRDLKSQPSSLLRPLQTSYTLEQSSVNWKRKDLSLQMRKRLNRTRRQRRHWRRLREERR